MQTMAAPTVPMLIAWPVMYLGALLMVSRAHERTVGCILLVDVCEGGNEGREIGDHDLVPRACGSDEMRCLGLCQLRLCTPICEHLTRLFDSQAITSGLQGKIPAATWAVSATLRFVFRAIFPTRKVPPYWTIFRSVEMSMIYPTIVTTHPTIMYIPRCFVRSEIQQAKRTVTKPHMFGGT